MKNWKFIIGVLMAATFMLPKVSLASSEDFEKAMRAFAAKDYSTAFGFFEAAIAADPNNIQYASEYRQAVVRWAKQVDPRKKEGRPQDYDRCVKFFERLTLQHPKSANAWLNYGLAKVDRIPAEYGAIKPSSTIANEAIKDFTGALNLERSWVNYYTRGGGYLYWPKSIGWAFGFTSQGVADLEQAVNLQKSGPAKPYYWRGYLRLGDGYWKADNSEKARSIWQEGLNLFPASAKAIQADDPKLCDLSDRLSKEGQDLKSCVERALDPFSRINTDLRDIWMNR